MKAHGHTTPTPTSPADLPTTGRGYLDQAVDRIDPVAKLAFVALWEALGSNDDGAAQLAVERIKGQVGWMEDPHAVESFCISQDRPDLEEQVAFWAAFRAGTRKAG